MKRLKRFNLNCKRMCFLKVLWGSCPRRKEETAILRQRLCWCAPHPVSVCHSVHLSGHRHQRHHVWRLAWRRDGKHAGKAPPSTNSLRFKAVCQKRKTLIILNGFLKVQIWAVPWGKSNATHWLIITKTHLPSRGSNVTAITLIYS